MFDEVNIKNIIVLAAAAFSIIAPPVILGMLSVMAVFMLMSFLV